MEVHSASVVISPSIETSKIVPNQSKEQTGYAFFNWHSTTAMLWAQATEDAAVRERASDFRKDTKDTK